MPSDTGPTPSEFLADAERELLDRAIESQQAEWVYATFITPDTEALSAVAQARLIEATVASAKRAAGLPRHAMDAVAARKVDLLRLSLPLIAPAEGAAAAELAHLVAAMTGTYGRGQYAPRGETTPLDLQGLSRLLAERRDPVLLLDVWKGWHAVGRSMRGVFERYVELSNRGAVELGFADTGAMWRSKYEMPPADFAREAERLWEQVRPFYRSLHAFVRRRLSQEYGEGTVPLDGPLPAHLLGNMWAQTWEHLLDRLLPPTPGSAPDLSGVLRARGVEPAEMVRYAERFFVSLGFAPLPETFWTRSMFTKPRDRDVICHASAWDLDLVEDLRIKMCIEPTEEDFQTIHHELGHNYYQRAYAGLPYLFRDGAHDGFHEAVGDTIGLSVTPAYLAAVGLREGADGAPGDDVRLLLASALSKVAFLPFGLLIDQWRWKVFAGEIPPEQYNATWWELRRRQQGIAPPEPRGPEEFDPGAKFHVAASVPYMRYFLAHLLQFQFHRALAREVDAATPLHRVSIFGSRAAGDRLRSMLEMGQSRPWPEALEAVTGERRMDAGALLEYYQPLIRWLDEQNRGERVGW